MNIIKNSKVCITTGLILMGGAINIFISNNAVYRLESQLSRMQEAGRFIIDVMAKEIRMAGYNGCASRGTIEPNVLADDPPPLTAGDENAVTGYDYDSGSWVPPLPAFITAAAAVNATVLDNTDVIIVQRADSCSATLTGNLATVNANIQITMPNDCGFVMNQAVIITDCSTTDIFAISSNPDSGTLAHANNINSENFLSKAYTDDSIILKQLSSTFYIADGASGEPALWLASWDPSVPTSYNLFELADGVEQIQILYGVDNDNDDYADVYLEADDAALTDWTTVKSVRINLLLHSADRITTDVRAFNFNGADANLVTQDRRLRMAFSTTVTLRNRLP